jgi:hypothetical protein
VISIPDSHKTWWLVLRKCLAKGATLKCEEKSQDTLAWDGCCRRAWFPCQRVRSWCRRMYKAARGTEVRLLLATDGGI